MTKVEEFDVKFGYLVINGEYYEGSQSKTGSPTLKRLDKKVIENKISKARKIAKKLKNSLDREKVITEAVMLISDKDVNKLHKMLFEGGRNFKPKTREHHCVDMKVGNFVLPIVGGR
jgi:hypothetical protein